MRRALVVAATLVAALAVAAPARALETPMPPLRDADYFAFADRIAEEMESSFKEDKGRYGTGASSIDTIANAAMLTIYATSAAYGHMGPARDDARARLLAEKLTAGAPDGPYFTAAAPPKHDKMFHTPGWTSNMEGSYVDMDKSIDPKVAEGLQMAWRARDTIGLTPETAAAIQTQIHAVSHTAFFRYPLVRLNQINWPAELYAYDFLVNGDAELLRSDYREQVDAFTNGFHSPQVSGGPGNVAQATNVGPSYRFIYQSNQPFDTRRNVDSTEYATMTQHFTYWYDLARQAGMAALPTEVVRLLRGWTQRNLYGDWTHAGFFQWDTGWSYERWMKGKAWAYGMQGLIATAGSPTFNRRDDERAYAKYLFDRGLRLYERFGEQRPASPFRPSAQIFGIGEQGAPATKMFWARMGANAVRAVSAGMGSMPAKEPPPFYAYDADIGRLAVSTPRYSTAIMATSRGIVPYGGVELARLYDADGDPVTGTGGKGRNAFGAIVRSRGGRRLLQTQVAQRLQPRRPPLTLTDSPRGRVTKQRRLASQPDAGPFKDLAVDGIRRDGGVRSRSSYRFRRNSIDVRWGFVRTDLPEDRARTRKGRRKARRQPVRPDTVTLHFPVSGRNGTIGALLRDGTGVPLTPDSAPLDLARVKLFYLRGTYGAYRIELPDDAAGRTRVLSPRWQRPNPRGGPVLTVELPALRRGTLTFDARVIPDADGGVGEPTTEEAAADPTPTPVPEAGATPGP